MPITDALISGLFRTEGALRTLLASLAEGVIIIDTAGTILLANPRAEAIFGYPQGALVGLPHAALIPERYHDVHEAHMAQYFAEPKVRSMGQLLDLVGRRRDGSEVPVEISLSFIATGSGLAVIAFVSDITPRKEAEAEIRRLNADLATHAAELETINQELEAFNYTVAHDLRKPLTVINGYCEAISELCGERLDAACRDYLQEAYAGTLRMNRLIDALLEFSRVARAEVRREAVDLSALAHASAAELRQAEPGRRVVFRIDEGVGAIGDAELLRVVLDNLIGNAWKYTGTRAEGIIEFGVAMQDGQPVYFVRDNGSGFSMADAAKLFIPFRRLPGAEKFRGFGIGLATVERIIRRQGGTIWAEGEPGKGATFYFTVQVERNPA